MADDTQAMIGYGTVFEMADAATPTVFVPLGEVINVDPGEDDDEEVEATHYTSPDRTREYIPGMTTPGAATVEGNYIPGSATDLMIIAARGKKNRGRITLPNGVRTTFPVVRRGYSQAIPLDDRMTFQATFKRAGAKTTDTATLPVNGVPPSIATSAARVGVVMTAQPGIWAPFANFAYQWKKGGTNIAGATDKTYTPVVGDVGAAITVTVTATNSAGAAAPVTSLATPNVVAA
ncbi:phage tail tube protein [Devosia sp. 2618]|uniref:phage tail tube protein n=1 Tax=Devosia sp. 2618 TaxID=3156454 RepID=UPI0033958574